MQAGWTNLVLSVHATRPVWRPSRISFLLSALLWALFAWVAVELLK